METKTPTHMPPHIGRASDLTNPRDRRLYRFFEILPGAMAWVTIFGCIALSYWAPLWAAVFIIVFDFYWLLKTVYLSSYLRQNWRRLRHNQRLNWGEMLANLKYDHIFHLVLLPYYKEGADVIEKCLESFAESRYDNKRILVVLAPEERAGAEAQKIAADLQKKYGEIFGDFLISVHPANLPGEMAGKGSNISWAAEQARLKILDTSKIPYGDVLVSAFDIDTVVYPDYFACVTWNFLTVENPYRNSFQPVPLYNNNMWDAPALSRVVAASGSFWQMIQQEHPEKLVTFSSHSLPFKTLYEIGYWQRNMVSEDSRIFWNAFFAYDGDYMTTPISYPLSMDANLAPTLWQTGVNIYKQQRRWGWGVENIPYILFNLVKSKKIRPWRKVRIAAGQLERTWSLSTNPILIFLLSWLPLIIGGPRFNGTILSYNLPIVTRNLMILAMCGLVFSAIISMSFLPKKPAGHSAWRFIFMVLQWIFIPITITLFGALPGLDAQTRLMLGRYMGFWVTPKEKAILKA